MLSLEIRFSLNDEPNRVKVHEFIIDRTTALLMS